MPWQQHVADVGLELDSDGSLVYGEVDLEVGRQEGKTELKFVLMVMRLTAMTNTHGPQRATYTMQDRKKARTRLERDYAPRLRSAAGFREMDSRSRARPTRRTDWRLGMNSGVEHIQFGPDSWLQIDTPSRTGSHGDTLDLGMIDEAFAHQDDTIEVGMEPAMLTRRDAQLWVMSAAGDGRSKYLWRKILRGRKLIEEGADAGVAYFEWSAPDDSDPGSPLTWAGACPGLGFTVPEAKLEALWRKALEGGQDAIDAFCRAYLCQWPEVPILDDDTAAFRVIPADDWAACEDINHRATGHLAYALDVDTNAKGEEWCSIDASDGVHIEIVTPPNVGPGTSWVVPAVVAKKDVVGHLILDPAGPAGKLIGPLEEAGIKIRKVSGQEATQACMHLVDRIREGRIRHIGQPRLTRAVAKVHRRDVGDGAYRFSRRLSPEDISPINAAAFACWGSQSAEGPSVYQDRGLLALG